ncbi:hypothetical protein KY321_01680 [Candidatus Woesearchaeota archaeon]|nr:hypothetical protein [Candidatus Woesearchaeota archaeon]
MANGVKNIFEAVKTVGQQDFAGFVGYSNSQDLLSMNKYTKMFTNGFNFVQFGSLKESFDFIDDLRKRDPNNGYLYYVKKDRYKTYDDFTKFLDSDNADFKEAKQITENIFENIKNFINIGGLYKNDKIIITEDKRGMFDFGLASLGLYRPIEFYSEKLKEDIQNDKIKNPYSALNYPDGLVNSNDIKTEKFGEKRVFTFKSGKTEYPCERRQKGTTAVFNEFSDDCYLDTNDDGITLTYNKNTKKVFNGKAKIRLKYASTNKKSYLMYQRKEDNVKYVDIFMPVNFLPVEDDARVVSLMTPFLIAGALEEFGVSVRISAMRIGSDSEITTSISIPVKDYNESVGESFNKAFNILGQKGVAGDFFAFFKTYFQANSVQTRKQKNQGSSFYDVKYYNKDYMDEMMQRYKNWASANSGASFINTKVTNPNFQFAVKTKSYGESNKTTYKFIMQNLHDIFYNFYYYMDFLALEMLPMQEFVKQIYGRFNDDKSFNSLFAVPQTTKMRKKLIRTYVLKMLVEKYSYVRGGMYEDTLVQEKEKEETFKSKLTFLDEAINSM